MIERHVYLDFHIDTNRINSQLKLKYMNVLEQWHERDIIYIAMSEVAQKEAVKNGDGDRAEKAYAYVATETLARTSDELKVLRQIQELLFPHGIKSRNEWNDVEVVFNAHKYFAILITNDGGSGRQPNGILGKTNKLREMGIQVLRDYEAVELVKRKIIARDQRAREFASTAGALLPDWVGKDLDVLEDTATTLGLYV